MKFDYVFDDEPDVMDVNKTIRVVYCEPGKYARVIEIGSELADLQSAVGGYIETFYGLDDPGCCAVCNEEGKINGMQPCRAMYGEDGKMLDVIFGPFFICDCRGEEFASLSDAQIEKFMEQFERPELLMRDPDAGFKMVPYSPDRDMER